MLGWDYPKNNNLHDRIQSAGIYPITVLQNLSAAQAEILIGRDIITCSDIMQNKHVLKQLHLSKRKHATLITEVESLCPKNKSTVS